MKALIVVDMQNDFLDEQGVLYCGPQARKIIPKVREIIKEYLSQGNSVIFTQDAHTEGDKEFEVFPKHCIKDKWGHEIIPQLKEFTKEKNAYVVQKARYSAFYNTNLESILQKLKPDEVAVVGVCTSICVMDTVGDLRNRDYVVKVFKDMVADFDEDMHRFSLERMKRIYAAEVT
jgi:nicotinamidase-related amidase